MAAAQAVKKAGAQFLRAELSSEDFPYSFQGLKKKIKTFKRSKRSNRTSDYNEVTSERAIEIADSYVDMFQVGARNVRISSFCARLVAPRNLFC